ncbi:DUF177 domain-containing protein [Roseomonas aerophila]|uniref:DUF177 domain-containing protein n=1 Tax=Teichococcus aerophilus TaxID=1224513 RepID=A0ABR7RH24_9PROT|nr:DUF177 domain-containing protein [Pseudoroseomonas aerophila]MBC9205865.1 DUF177 domain-containing protein [Pseudoroseomonas aerophila]
MSDAAPEFSRPFPWGTIGKQERREEVQATPKECAALAARFGILAIEALSASLRLRQESGGAVRVRGRLAATVVQPCVVTLEPVRQTVDEAVDLRFLPPGAEMDEDPEGPDEIPTENDVLELGEALAEQLSLALDPYPRAPGASLEEGFSVGDDEPAPESPAPRPNPFAVLKGLKRDN